jgi:hypothetical protein
MSRRDVSRSSRMPTNCETDFQDIISMNGLLLLADGATTVQDLSIFNLASPPAESIRSFFILVLAIALFSIQQSLPNRAR